MGQESSVVTVRLTADELQGLESHTQGLINRSQIIHALIQDFLEKPEKEQRAFLVKRLFSK